MLEAPVYSTLTEAFAHRVAESGAQPAVIFRRDGAFTHIDWHTLADEVYRTTAALIHAGCQTGDRVVQLSENRVEWIVADLAILFARCVHVPLHATLSSAQVVAQIGNCLPRVVIVSNQNQADKLARLRDLASVRAAYFSHDTCNTPLSPGPDFTRLADAAARITSHDAAAVVAPGLNETRPDDLATILYTSGTTGEPKGVMLTHANLCSNAAASVAAFATTAGDLRLSILPWSHIFARTCDLYTWIFSGATLAVEDDRERIVADCAVLRPTLLNAVPYFFDRLHRHAEAAGELETPGHLRDRLGGRIRFCLSGGAPLPRHVDEWFARQGVALYEGYGLTETSPVITTCSPAAHRAGSVGRPLADIEVRIASDGEILTRGPHVMRGYYNNPAATAEVLRDGWFHTGDLGHLEEGYLFITGRKKDLIVTAGGKNVAPLQLETLLAEDPLVHQAIVVGDGRKYLAALIVPDAEALRTEIFRRHLVIASREAALADPQVLAIYQDLIAARLAGLSRHEQIGRFCLVSRAFSQDRDELTPTLKPRRAVIAENFAPQIAAMYA